MILEDCEVLFKHLSNMEFQNNLHNVKGVLGEKLRELYLYRMQQGKGEFSVYLLEGVGIKGEPKMNANSAYYDYRKTDEHNWQYMTGPSSYDEFYYYGDSGFEHYPFLFHLIFESYISFRDSDVVSSFADIIARGDIKEYLDRIGNETVVNNVEYYMLNMEEMRCENGYYLEDDEEEEMEEVSEEDYYEAFFYAMWYLEISMQEKVDTGFPIGEADHYFEKLLIGTEDAGCSIGEYIDSFLERIASYLELKDSSSYRYVFPVLERGLLSCLTDREGNTLHAYVFTSKNVKEYVELRKEYPDGKYVAMLDVLLNYVMEPLKLKGESCGSSLIQYPGEVYSYDFFAPSEYVCAYLYFPEGKIFFHPLLKEIRGCFDYLFSLYKEECEQKEKVTA